MSNEQSIRDAAAEWIAGLISGNGFGDDYVDDEVKQWADDLLSSPVIRRIQAEALRDHAKAVLYWERGHSPRIMSHSVERIVADLNDRADRIERGGTA